MRLLLIYPRLPESFWSFRWALQEIVPGKRAINPPLGLATVAALCPPGWHVRIVDENVEALPLRPDVDLIGIGGMGVQAPRQKELLRYYRKAGYYTVAGGSYASLCPEEYEGIADSVVAGEAEYIWPRFCADFARGEARPLYRETGDVALRDSPPPRFDLLKLERYSTATVQLSRGCPFRCEFCDIIVMFGRRPRYKSTEQIGRELDALRALGARKIFFVDDNFIGNKALAKQVLAFLEGWQAVNGRSTRFGTEASLNLAADEELMRRFRAAGFEWLFMGIETPDAQALKDAGKTQNCAQDLLQSVRRIYAHGLDILAGFIVGFDRDTPAAFRSQERFIRDSGIMVAMVGLLTALPKTPLYERLQREGRLMPGVPHGDNTGLRTNVVPKSMTSAQLVEGYRRLYRSLLADGVIAERIRNKLAHFGAPARLRRDAPREAMAMVWNLLRRGIAQGGPLRAWHFLRSLPITRPSLVPLALNDWVAGLAMRDYADRHLRVAAAAARGLSAERAFARLKRSMRRLRRQGRVRLAMLRAQTGDFKIAFQVSGALDRKLARRLARQAARLLSTTQARLVLSLEQVRDAVEQRELDRLARRLARYGDRALIVLGDGVRDLLRLEAPAPAAS